MIVAAVGWTGIILGLAGSVALAVQGLRAQRHPAQVRRAALNVAVGGMVAGAAVAFVALEVALLTDDFAVSYVAANHARATPLLFTVTSAWSALEGSILLWVLVLAGFTAAVLRGVRDTFDRLGTGALGVMGLVATFFFGLVSTAANPFRILAVVPPDGPGPNPLLQNHILVAFHPPLLYLGYVGFTVPFAFAMSALLRGEAGRDWLRRTRRANLVAWTALSGGLVLGAWWSYEVLGWGGFWAWDPVENAALIPWLVATAFVHSAVVQLRRGMQQAWNVVLAIAVFALTVLGTFLTRSSVVASVHGFTRSAVGPMLLGFLVLVLVGSFGLFAVRGQRVVSGGRPESLLSREGAFLVNNVLLALLAFVVLVGTVYPVFVEAFTGAQVSVGRPFFDRMAVPLGFALLLIMAVGPFLPYRLATRRVLADRLRWPLLAASAAAAVLVVAGVRSVAVVLAVFLAVGTIAGSARELLASAPSRSLPGLLRLVRGRRGYWGGQIAHVGVLLVAVSIAVSGALAERSSATLAPGQSLAFAGYTVTYDRRVERQLPDRKVVAARFVLRRGGVVVRVAEPRLSTFRNQVQAVAAPSVWTTPRQDIYLALTRLDDQRAAVNLYRYPLMWLLWAAGLLVVLGGLWAIGARVPVPRRLRAATDNRSPRENGPPVLPAATSEVEKTAGQVQTGA